MQFSTVLFSAIAFAMGASAMPAPPADTRYAQLRLFGEAGCSAQNQGELGVYGDYVNKCNTFRDTTVKSVRFEYAINNCRVRVYSDLTCHLDAHDVALKTCLSGDKIYRSYEVICDSLEV